MKKTNILQLAVTAATVLLALVIMGCASSAPAGTSSADDGKAAAPAGNYVRVLLSYDEDEAYLKSGEMGVLAADGSLMGKNYLSWGGGVPTQNTAGIEASGLAGSKAGYVIVNDIETTDPAKPFYFATTIAYSADEFNTAITDWKGAEYLQFYVKNGGETINIDRLDIVNPNGSEHAGYGILGLCNPVDQGNPEAYYKYQERTIGGGWVEKTYEQSRWLPDYPSFASIVIEPNFEGFIRIKLEDVLALDRVFKRFNTWNEGRAIVTLAMRIHTLSEPGGKLILDDIAIVGSKLHYTKGAVPEADYFSGK